MDTATDVKSAARHVEMLQAELDRRKRANPRYSLRRFAQQLGIDPSMLCRIMAGKQELSAKSTQQILSALRLSESEEHEFKMSLIERARLKAAKSLEHAEPVAEPRKTAHTRTFKVNAERVPEALALFETFASTLERLLGPGSCEIELSFREVAS